jgi:hypothetical protein
MSRATQLEFQRLLLTWYELNHSFFELSSPVFEENGFVTTAYLSGNSGCIELMCAPAEYHVDFSILTNVDNKRWTFTDLIGIEVFYNWLMDNPVKDDGRSLLQTEIDEVFRFIRYCLSTDIRFKWICRLQ